MQAITCILVVKQETDYLPGKVLQGLGKGIRLPPILESSRVVIVPGLPHGLDLGVLILCEFSADDVEKNRFSAIIDVSGHGGELARLVGKIEAIRALILHPRPEIVSRVIGFGGGRIPNG